MVAPKEYDAIQAAAILKVTYGDPPTLPSSGNLYERDAGPGHGRPGSRTDRARAPGNTDAAYAAAANKVAATYKYQYNGHMPIGPTCAVADVTSAGALVMANTQDAYTMRSATLAGGARICR